MIHDAIVPVTCDNEKCQWYRNLYRPFSIKIDGGESDPADIEWDLKDHGWIIINGKHYCSQECADEAEDGKA